MAGAQLRPDQQGLVIPAAFEEEEPVEDSSELVTYDDELLWEKAELLVVPGPAEEPCSVAEVSRMGNTIAPACGIPSLLLVASVPAMLVAPSEQRTATDKILSASPEEFRVGNDSRLLDPGAASAASGDAGAAGRPTSTFDLPLARPSSN
jgi:hypothetical protein